MQLSLKLDSSSIPLRVIDETILLENLNTQLPNLPAPEKELLPGIRWGSFSQLFTPAYWKMQYLMYNHNGSFYIDFKLGQSILEEVVACLLGGFGLKSEVGLAAFYRLRERNLIEMNISFSSILNALKEPFRIDGKKVHYRFPNQKSKFIYQFLNRMDLESIPLDSDLALRDWLLSINGIGPKTASWITRNYLKSERVAIIDIHIFRALQVMGFLSKKYDIQRDYFKLEKIFLSFCEILDVQPSKMDALMWLQMKESNRVALKAISNI